MTEREQAGHSSSGGGGIACAKPLPRRVRARRAVIAIRTAPGSQRRQQWHLTRRNPNPAPKKPSAPSDMPPQQGDNEEEAEASPAPAPARAGGGGKGHSGSGDDVTVRVVHTHKRKGSGGDGDGIAEEKPVELLNGAAAAAEEEEELRATPDMVHYCFEVLLHHFRGGAPPKPAFNTAVECPLFVTWEKEQPASSRSHHLRGCIGTLSPRPLEALGDYVHSRCALRWVA